jgi:hypothetical protein
MSIEEMKWLAETLLKYGFGGLVAGLVAFLLLKHYVSGYLAEKGKNLAAKEDIAELTELVRIVQHEYDLRIKAVEAKQQLRMAAMDKRLQTHQASLPLWRKVMLASSDNSKIVRAYYDCRTWYFEN